MNFAAFKYNGEWYGTWSEYDGNSEITVRGTIEGNVILWPDGEKSIVYNDEHSNIFTELHGERIQGSLNAAGEIDWDDGDLWIRVTQGELNYRILIIIIQKDILS